MNESHTKTNRCCEKDRDTCEGLPWKTEQTFCLNDQISLQRQQNDNHIN